MTHRVRRFWTRHGMWGPAAAGLWLTSAGLLSWDSVAPEWMVGRWGLYVAGLALAATFRRFVVEIFDLGIKVERAAADIGIDAVGTRDFDPARQRR